MLKLHDFGIDVKNYFLLGIGNIFPLVACGKCGRQDRLKRNGFRWRYVLGPDTGGKALLIPIQVYYCSRCHKVTSVLPSFCVPYKIHTLLCFESFFLYLFVGRLSLSQAVQRARKRPGYYQLAQAWIKSFKSNIINLTCELRTLLPWKDCSGAKPSGKSSRYPEVCGMWWVLQRAAHHAVFECCPEKLPLERAQYVLWQKRRLGLFGFIN